MGTSIALRSALVALVGVFGVGLKSAHADSGTIVPTIYKAGWIIGGSGGGSTLTFRAAPTDLGSAA
jgi:lipid-binding SYLF domain-containing protein